jgi:predicted nucleic acid-binding protein
MTGTLFVDTNVFIYSRDAREPHKRARARQWLEYLWREQLGRTSGQVLNEYYNAMTRQMRPPVPPATAWDSVDALFAWNPQVVDQTLLRRGRAVEERHKLSWWDSLVVAAAEAQACAVLLSEDLQDGCSYGTVIVLNPFKAAWPRRARATRRHRWRFAVTARAAGRSGPPGPIDASPQDRGSRPAGRAACGNRTEPPPDPGSHRAVPLAAPRSPGSGRISSVHSMA